jgi:hypothetical protein
LPQTFFEAVSGSITEGYVIDGKIAELEETCVRIKQYWPPALGDFLIHFSALEVAHCLPSPALHATSTVNSRKIFCVISRTSFRSPRLIKNQLFEGLPSHSHLNHLSASSFLRKHLKRLRRRSRSTHGTCSTQQCPYAHLPIWTGPIRHREASSSRDTVNTLG